MKHFNAGSVDYETQAVEAVCRIPVLKKFSLGVKVLT